MIDISGPCYQYQGEQICSPEIIVVHDHHYNEHDQSFHVEKLLRNSACNPAHHVVVFDHVLAHNDVMQDYNMIFFPSFMARENTEFIDQQIKINWSNKTRIFNFMINKPRPHRKFLLQLIDEYQLDNFFHSLAWRTNPINHIPVTNFVLGTETVLDQGVKSGHIRNAETYQKLLQGQVFEPTCVSLVTEPAFYERETIVTEKTLMAIWAGTVPIWVGGWRIADWMQSQGFEVFDDLVDHSYQNLPDPLDRCRKAIKLNLSVLKNFDLVKNYLQQNQQKFHHNLLLLQSNFFKHSCIKIMQHAPDSVIPVLKGLLKVDLE